MRKWLNTKEVAHKLGVSQKTLYRYIQKGIIPYYRVYGRYLFDPEDVDKLIISSKYNPEKNKEEIIFSEF